MRLLNAIVILLFSCLAVFAQEDSVADAARKTHASASKAKTLITDETLNYDHGPLPEMNIDGVDNSDDIINAIKKYKENHTPDETEVAVRGWYDRYDMMFQKAFDENTAIRARIQDRAAHPPSLIYREEAEAYRRIDEIRRDEMMADLQNQRKVQKNGLLEARIQQTLQKVRTGIGAFGLRYEWMKIRFGNGNGSW